MRKRKELKDVAKREDTYTHRALRERLKEKAKASDKGRRADQWSARKSQLLTKEYEKAGGGYKGEKTEDQKSLEKWTEEAWTTQDEEEGARRGDDTARYLPKEAWEKLSPEDKEATEEKKRKGSKKGEQYIENTKVAREARKEAAVPIAGYDELSVEEVKDQLEGLSEDELKKVRSYEKKHKNRKTLLERLDRNIKDAS